MRYLFAFLMLCGYLLPTYSSAEPANIQSLVSQGTGTSYESAAQNATENALIQAVGSFIDTETNIEKKKVIADGVRSKSKSITKETKEYSQGSIAYFEVLSAEETEGLWRVEARVDVRIEDFKAYIKEFASAEQDVGVGLFAQMSVENEQTEDKVSLLINNVTDPIISGEVYNIEIGAATPIKSYIKEHPYEGVVLRGSPPNPQVQFMKKWEGKPNVVVFPVKVSLKPEFLENALNVLDNLAEKKQRWTGSLLQCGGRNLNALSGYKAMNRQEDFALTYSKTPKNHITYFIPGVGTPLSAQYDGDKHPFFKPLDWTKLSFSPVQISLSDKEGLVLREDIFDYKARQRCGCCGSSQLLCTDKSLFIPTNFGIRNGHIGHLFLVSSGCEAWQITPHREFVLVMQLTPDELKRTRKIEMKYFKD